MSIHDGLRGLVSMRCRNMTKCWTCYVGKRSVLVIECDYDHNTWNIIWKDLKKLYDTHRPKHPKTINENKKKYEEALEKYISENSRIIGEVPKKHGKIAQLKIGEKFSAYSKQLEKNRKIHSISIEEDFTETCFNLAEIIEEGINFMRVEASEILAFVATDSDRICKPDLPPHIPIAYGLRGASLNMKTMRNMVNDIRNELKRKDASVLCEVFDGQFHSLIVKSEIGEPLTRMQHSIHNFKEMMSNNDRFDMIEKLLLYSQITEKDQNEIGKLKFRNGQIKDFDNVRIEMKKILRKSGRNKSIIRKVYIETIPIEHWAMKDIVTCHRQDIWNRFLKKSNSQNTTRVPSGLTAAEIKTLIEGSKIHRRISKKQDLEELSEISDEEGDDPDYIPDNESQSSDSESDVDLDENAVHDLSNVSSTSTGQSCIKQILCDLKKIDNKHNWKDESVDSFIRKYLSRKRSIEKLFKYEMDIMNNQVVTCFGKSLFNKSDSKAIRVTKICQQLRQMPQLLLFDSSEEEIFDKYEPKTLLQIYKNFVTSNKYPKEYLAAPLCEIGHFKSVKKWESNSTIPIQVELPFLEENHIIFNYPEWSTERKQPEMRTFDYTHILNNLRFHICNKGFEGVSKDAFMKVSEINHDVLPRAIVEDKMDRQNSTISQRFFSEDVEKILKENGYTSEAQFCMTTRNWFRACDERGMEIPERLKHLNTMYDLLLSKCRVCEYPPPTTHVKGIPIRTFEAVLHTISTRFSLFGMSSTKSYNTRAISTLAVESFFSDLTRYEFSGLGAPKAVDIPKLISHVVHVNTTKHNPRRGFEFTTSTRDNYPTYLMETDTSIDSNSSYAPSAFDVKINNKKKKNKRWFHLAKPKEVTKGGKGVRQYFKVDETKLTDEQRLGKNVSLTDCDI